jgi:ActR/RegA family two-component response regulator
MEEQDATKAAPQAGDIHVLLVDDHAPVLRFLAAAFKRQECVVSTASSAEEALDPSRTARSTWWSRTSRCRA